MFALNKRHSAFEQPRIIKLRSSSRRRHSINQLATDDTNSDMPVVSMRNSISMGAHEFTRTINIAGGSEENNIDFLTLRVIYEHTILHRILGIPWGNKILHILFNQCIIVIFTILIAIFLIAIILESTNFITIDFASELWIISHALCLFMLYVYIFILLLATNKTAAELILKTFEFWFKVVYGLRYVICSTVYWSKYDKSLTNSFLIADNIAKFTGLLLFCFLDGLKMPFRVKVTILIIGSLMFLWHSVDLTLIRKDPCFASLHLWGDYAFNFDVKEWAAASMRIITIFIWKQTYFSIFKAPKSTLIKKSVKIIWL